MSLDQLLHTTFGFPGFRANQEAVCRAATDGRDVLLVMPTGAGKSLCYQLPAVARGGPALVISPLIALMEDQAAKLSALGLRVGRIHSGMPREESRARCREYLDGTLQFLFIAPERMRVPGFPQMLAKRTPSLVAIDEAHCISAWGHDFRPDYRTLGEHLPALRPAPIVALTATATPTVQRDIAAQLQLRDPALFIHGFRRSNLAIEVVEMSKPQRHGFTAKLLKEEGRRPAIVYAPSRKAAEELAGELGRLFPAAAYHAGLDAATRERVQTAFLGGKLEVVVATIAFGMGIDKADVRTVVHTALPASVEAFYQEIGRAGRDGLPSRTVLLHSFADRKMHEFFLERDYPPATDLARVARVLTEDFLMPEPLAREMKMDPYQFQKAIEKLVAQGAAAIDVAGNVRRVGAVDRSGAWRGGYEAQIAFRKAQLDAMAGFAEMPQCRMSALIRHFGDTADGLRPCGHCDVCAPEAARGQSFREPNGAEARGMRSVLSALRGVPSRATGRLFTDLGGGMERREFDGLLDAMTRAGLVSVSSETFTKDDGSVVPYRKVSLTHEGREDAAAELVGVLVPDCGEAGSPAKARSGKRAGTKAAGSSARASRSEDVVALTAAQGEVEQSLKAWRAAEAKKTGKPAFLVFGDAVLRSIAAAGPRTLSGLAAVSGVGPLKLEAYGAAVLALCNGRADSVAVERPGAPMSARSAEGGASGSPRSPVRGKSQATQPMAERSKKSSRQSLSDDTIRMRQVAGAAVPSSALPAGESRPAFARTYESGPALEVALTADQAKLDERLREWRKGESERLGLPQFFVLAASSLRGIVLKRPRTVEELGSVAGLDPEKMRQFGQAIVEICNG
ncbi:MAG: hypothetical protein NVSMB62_01980 [Acidobacteriaceae bacterium]